MECFDVLALLCVECFDVLALLCVECFDVLALLCVECFDQTIIIYTENKKLPMSTDIWTLWLRIRKELMKMEKTLL